MPGSFVVTRPARDGPWAKSNPGLLSLDNWLWRIIKVALSFRWAPSPQCLIHGVRSSFRFALSNKVGYGVSLWLVLRCPSCQCCRLSLVCELLVCVAWSAGSLDPSQVIQAGEAVPGWKTPAEEVVYQAHLYHPRRKSKQSKQSKQGSPSGWSPLYVDERTQFMSGKTLRERGLWGKPQPRHEIDEDADDEHLTPVCCYLRAGNVMGGGFSRTAAGNIPAFVQNYALRCAALA